MIQYQWIPCLIMEEKKRKQAINIQWNKEFIVSYINLFELKILATLKVLNLNEKTNTNYDSFFEATPQVSLS